MQHRDMLPFLITQVIENERKRKITFFVSVSKNAMEGIFRGYYQGASKNQRCPCSNGDCCHKSAFEQIFNNTLIARSDPKPFLSMGIGKNDKDTVLSATS